MTFAQGVEVPEGPLNLRRGSNPPPVTQQALDHQPSEASFPGAAEFANPAWIRRGYCETQSRHMAWPRRISALLSHMSDRCGKLDVENGLNWLQCFRSAHRLSGGMHDDAGEGLWKVGRGN